MLPKFNRAFDTYSEIRWTIKNKIDSLVFKDTRAMHRSVCPSCSYQLQGEPKLDPEMLVAVDGNESLRRVERRREDENGVERVAELKDSRTRTSPLFIERPRVDAFKNEVMSRRKVRSSMFWCCVLLTSR